MTASAYIVAARRTPIGKFMGGLARVPAPTLGSYVAKALFADCPGAAAHVDECIARLHVTEAPRKRLQPQPQWDEACSPGLCEAAQHHHRLRRLQPPAADA